MIIEEWPKESVSRGLFKTDKEGCPHKKETDHEDNLLKKRNEKE